MKIIFVGKSCSGKDYARSLLSDTFKFGCWHTTRPPRDNEVDGVDYHFVIPQKYFQSKSLGGFKTESRYNEWAYGLTNKSWEENQAFLGNLAFLKLLSLETKLRCLIIYLNPPDEIIFDRLQKKAMPGDTWERRYCQDRIDFQNFSDYDIEITNPEFTCEELMEIISTNKLQ